VLTACLCMRPAHDGTPAAQIRCCKRDAPS
jgi:hypothetical protein